MLLGTLKLQGQCSTSNDIHGSCYMHEDPHVGDRVIFNSDHEFSSLSYNQRRGAALSFKFMTRVGVDPVVIKNQEGDTLGRTGDVIILLHSTTVVADATVTLWYVFNYSKPVTDIEWGLQQNLTVDCGQVPQETTRTVYILGRYAGGYIGVVKNEQIVGDPDGSHTLIRTWSVHDGCYEYLFEQTINVICVPDPQPNQMNFDCGFDFNPQDDSAEVRYSVDSLDLSWHWETYCCRKTTGHPNKVTINMWVGKFPNISVFQEEVENKAFQFHMELNQVADVYWDKINLDGGIDTTYLGLTTQFYTVQGSGLIRVVRRGEEMIPVEISHIDGQFICDYEATPEACQIPESLSNSLMTLDCREIYNPELQEFLDRLYSEYPNACWIRDIFSVRRNGTDTIYMDWVLAVEGIGEVTLTDTIVRINCGTLDLEETVTSSKIAVGDPIPNPFLNSAVVPIDLKYDSTVEIFISDSFGVLYSSKEEYPRGYREVTIDRSMFNRYVEGGVLTLTIVSGRDIAQRKVTLLHKQ